LTEFTVGSAAKHYHTTVDSARHPRAGEGSGREIGHTRLTSTIAFFRVCATCNHSTLPTTREETNTQKSGAWLFPALRLGLKVQSRNAWVCRNSQQRQFECHFTSCRSAACHVVRRGGYNEVSGNNKHQADARGERLTAVACRTRKSQACFQESLGDRQGLQTCSAASDGGPLSTAQAWACHMPATW
jgi:hypothetical protein